MENLTNELKKVRKQSDESLDRLDAATEQMAKGDRIRDTATSARHEAEDARDVAEAARDTAEVARSTAEVARGTAEVARGLAEVARSTAEKALDMERSTPNPEPPKNQT
jgi:methyl-accepting chemotaxis protein